ncbi:uncharacterized protein LOC132743238 [Ruditapes philippinarum]|uniref:uncharacterized protein LOC132743238 n=1 Tax=Ruditapes philippinarum TaxID=129788 RepID=UPI00295B599B|nr:uncharacterized protein LOC132743238 [Ruditapes philippinarum]
MAGLFRKRQFKPWIFSCVTAPDRHFKSKIVKVLCRRSIELPGSIVMLVSDGELSISAAFPDEAVNKALTSIGLTRSTRWDNSLLILQQFRIELKVKQGEDSGEYVVYVEKFNIWDLQPGYTAKFDVKYCMEDKKVLEKMAEEIREIKERAVRASECNNTDSIGLSQLLDEMAKPSEGFSQSSSQDVEEKSTKCTDNNGMTVTESLMEKLCEPFTVTEFLIPQSQLEILQNIPGLRCVYEAHIKNHHLTNPNTLSVVKKLV